MALLKKAQESLDKILYEERKSNLLSILLVLAIASLPLWVVFIIETYKFN